jgi:uncharacterized protein (DUF2461 family)
MYRYAIHPDGYAVYNVKAQWGNRKPENPVYVREVLATTPQAYRYMVMPSRRRSFSSS